MNSTSTRTFLRWLHSQIESAQDKGTQTTKTRAKALIEAREQFCLLSEIPVPAPEALFAKQKRKSVVFEPPTLKEAIDYAIEKNLKIDAKHWHAFYSARNWKYGTGGPMKNWKASMMQWENSEQTRDSSRMRAADEYRLEAKARAAQTQLRLMGNNGAHN